MEIEEDAKNSSGLSEFFSALSKEKDDTRQKIKENIDNPESGLSSLFQQLEEALQETKKVSVKESLDNTRLSTDDQNKLEVFSNLLNAFDSDKEIPIKVEPIDFIEELEPEEIIPEELVVESEEPHEIIEPQDEIIASVIRNLDDMREKTQVKEEVDQISSIRKEFDNFRSLIAQQIASSQMSGAGSGETRLEFLDDVDRDSVKSDGKALVYSSSDGKWKGETVLSGAITGLDIDGATDIGAAIVDADLFIIDDGASGTNRKATLSRLKTYIGAGAADDLGAGDAAVTLTTTSGNITIDAAANNSDIILKGTDGGADTTFLTIDGSAAGAATFNDKVVATELDISGNADIDGTMEADAYTVDGTALNEYIADTVGAMVSSNTETDIAVTYQDGDNTLDFVVGTLNQDTTGTAATVTTAAQTNITSLGTLTALTVDDVAINGKVVTMTGSSSDTAVFTAGTNGTLSIVTTDAAAAAANITITADGTAEIAGTTVTLNSSGGVTIDADNGTITFADAGSSLGTITSSGYTGNVVGNVSGTAATVTTAAQTNITSLGTLTALQIDNININGNAITSTAGTDLTISPLSGQQIVLDSTIVIDAGVVTGATSITSTAFVGDITGDVTGNADTATALATARTIGGTSFDGTANIAVGLAATATALASARTIGGTSFDGTANIAVGLAATATALASARTIGGTSFDGTANIAVALASVATAVTVTDNEDTNENNVLVFVAGADADGGNVGLESDGDLIYNPSTGTLSVPNIVVSGTQTIADTVTMQAENAIVFEGATADLHETTLTIIDPTGDRTINLPNQSGTIPVLAAASNTAITSTPAELNILDGVTSTAAELNILDGVTSTAAELNILDGVTSTAAELNILDGVTSTAAELNILDGATVVVGEINALDLGSTAVGTAIASKAVILDSNKDYTGIRNLTISGEIDAATGDFSGAVDIAGATTTAALTASGAISVDDTTDSTSGTTGSIHTDGGLGVAKEIYAGTGVTIPSGHDYNWTDTANRINYNGTAVRIFQASASVLECDGGLVTLPNTSGGLSVDSTTDTTSGTTGSIHTDGGLGVAKAAWVGTNLTVKAGTSGTGVAEILHNAGGTTTSGLIVETAIGSFTGSTIEAKNTLGSATSYDLYRGITDSDGDGGGPFEVFSVRGDGQVISSAGAAFSGLVTLSSGLASTDLFIVKTTGNSGTGLFVHSGTANQIDVVGYDGGAANALNLRSGGASGAGILIDTSNNVSMAGAVTVGAEGGSATTNVSLGLCKAWIRTSGAAVSIADSFNMTSITDSGVGLYAPVIANNMNDGNYALILGADDKQDGAGIFVHTAQDAVSQATTGYATSFKKLSVSAYSLADANQNAASSVLGDLA